MALSRSSQGSACTIRSNASKKRSSYGIDASKTVSVTSTNVVGDG